MVEFRLLVLDSLKKSSKTESPINRSAKAVISRNLTTGRHNHIFISFLNFSLIFYFIFHIFTNNRHQRLICVAVATVIGWPEWIKKCVFIAWEIRFSNSCLLWQTLKSEWCLLKNFRIRTIYFLNGYPMPAHMGNKWFNCCGEWFKVVTCSSSSQWFITNCRRNYNRW